MSGKQNPNIPGGHAARTRSAAPVAATLYQLNAALDRLRAAYLQVLAERRALQNNTTAAVERARMDAAAELSAVEHGGSSQQVAA